MGGGGQQPNKSVEIIVVGEGRAIPFLEGYVRCVGVHRISKKNGIGKMIDV